MRDHKTKNVFVVSVTPLRLRSYLLFFGHDSKHIAGHTIPNLCITMLKGNSAIYFLIYSQEFKNILIAYQLSLKYQDILYYKAIRIIKAVFDPLPIIF